MTASEPTRASAAGTVSAQRARLEELFAEHFDDVFGFCVMRCGSRQLAEEIVSDTFADAVRHVTSNDPRPLTGGWLITVARRRIIDHWRARQRNIDRVERLGRERVGALTEEVGRRDERVMRALDSLPDRQRAALTLRYLDELSVSETASALGVTYPAAESLIARAKRSFATAYERVPGDEL